MLIIFKKKFKLIESMKRLIFVVIILGMILVFLGLITSLNYENRVVVKNDSGLKNNMDVIEKPMTDCDIKEKAGCDGIEQVRSSKCIAEIEQKRGEGYYSSYEQKNKICYKKKIYTECGAVYEDNNCLNEIEQKKGEGNLENIEQKRDFKCINELEQKRGEGYC